MLYTIDQPHNVLEFHQILFCGVFFFMGQKTLLSMILHNMILGYPIPGVTWTKKLHRQQEQPLWAENSHVMVREPVELVLSHAGHTWSLMSWSETSRSQTHLS